jgi:pilus assembly protein CpaE
MPEDMDQSPIGPRIIAVGTPPTFRQVVARILETDAERIGWVPTVTAAEEYMAQGDAGTEVLVVSPTIRELDAFGLAQFVERTSPATAVVLVRDRTPNGILPPAMRAGIRDVVDLSKGSEDLREALDRAISWSAHVRGAAVGPRTEVDGAKGTVVSIFSSKGGTGKTFLTANLAVALSVKTGQDTAVLDGDLDMGDVFAYFGRDSNRTLPDLLAVGSLSERESILAAGTHLHEHLWGFAATLEPGAEPVSGEAMAGVIRTLRRNFAYTVVDASANYSDEALATFDVSDAIVLVTGLDIVGLRHLSSALRTLLSLGVPRDRFRIALNRADSRVGLDADEVGRVMKLRIDTMIPSSRDVPVSLNAGKPVYLSHPKSPVVKALGAFADQIIALSPVAAIVAPASRVQPEKRRSRLSRKQ